MERDLLVLFPLYGGADMDGNINDLHLRHFPADMVGDNRELLTNDIYNRPVFLQHLIHNGLIGIRNNRLRKNGFQVVGQVLKKIVVVVQVDFQFIRDAGNKLPCNHLYFHGVLFKGTLLPEIFCTVQHIAQKIDIVFRGCHAAILRDIAEDVLGHRILFTIRLGQRLQHLPQLVSVYHNAKIQLDIPKRGIRQELLMHVLLFTDDFLDKHRVPGLHAAVLADNALCGLLSEQPQEKTPFIALIPRHIKTFIGAGGYFQFPCSYKIPDAVQIVDNGRTADKKIFRNRRKRNISGCADQHSGGGLYPFIGGELIFIEISGSDIGYQLVKALWGDHLPAFTDGQLWLAILLKQGVQFLQIIADRALGNPELFR